MPRTSEQLRRDALRIWHAGLAAVQADVLMRGALSVDEHEIRWGDASLPWTEIDRVVVVGAGKAGAGMAAAVEAILGPDRAAAVQLAGLVLVPDDCVRPLHCIRLHGARPAGVNEPRPAGVAGAREMLQLVESLGPRDLCLCLLSGGGSALMPLPIDGISLDDKIAVTRHLSASGATIEEINLVRKQLSRIKGGGLARRCRAGRLVALIISDVPGNRLDVIASGPTVPDASTPEAALDVLHRFGAREAGIGPAVFDVLEHARRAGRVANRVEPPTCEVHNLIIGSNALAVDAAGVEAERLGYSHAMVCSPEPEGPAEEVGRHLADLAVRMQCERGPDCLISGGEPIVRLVEASRRGRGGRNQQLTLAALEHLESIGADGIALLSGGTDGEDGPTDAAGARLDPDVRAEARRRGLDASDYLARNDAYRFFEPLDALIKTGPTHTNVCDLRVVVVARRELTRE